MTKPLREPGLARQIGAINNILNSNSQVPCSSQPAHRTQEAKGSLGRTQTKGKDRRQARLSKDNKPYDQARSSQHLSRGSQSTFHRQEDRRRSRSPQRSSTARSDRHSDRSHRRADHRRNDQRRSGSPEREQQCDQNRTQSHAPKPVEEPKESRTPSRATNGDGHSVEPSSGKRKRTTADDGNDAERIQATKKQQINHPNAERPKQPLPRARIDQKNVAPRTAATTSTPVVKRQYHPEPKTLTQLPTPPSSNGTPERESHSEQLLKVSRISTPTLVEKIRSDPHSPHLTGAESSKSKKRQRDEDVSTRKEPKRLRQLEAIRPLGPQQMPPAGLLPTLQQARPVLQAQARVVRPESSFAPVTPNHTCELEFIDYLHDSVPVLYSSMISHSSNADFLNSPSGTLVVNALAIIGPSVDPQAKRGWPSAIELPGRTLSQNNPVKVLSDVDLYLHKKENELCVATDRGLITVTSYLKLIGVPKKQPVRFEGRVPSWAKTTFRTPERRRIVLLKSTDPRRFEIVPRDTALGTHQIALTLDSHVEVAEERQNLKEWEEQAKAEARVESESRLAVKSLLWKGTRQMDENKPPEPRIGEMMILSADPGHLPLRAGSIVLVYAVDDENKWAYGRLSGTDKMGRFPIEYTCPIDWSLDRFAGTNNNLILPLPDSNDPEEQDWRGPFHWMRQRGYTLGPTWRETVEAGAAKARDNKAWNMSASKAKMRTSTSFTAEVSKAQTERSASRKPSSDKPSPGRAPTVQVATAPLTATETSTTMENEVEEVKNVDVAIDCPEIEQQEAVSAGVGQQEPEGYEHNGRDIVVDVENTEAPAHQNPFIKPRLNLFARNDDIEYDWGDSDEEL